MKKHYKGIDAERALSNWRIVGAYTASLKLFVDIYSDIVDQLRASDIDKKRKLLHKLKGSAGMLELIDVLNSTKKLELIINDGGDLIDGLSELDKSMKMAIKSINRFLLENNE